MTSGQGNPSRGHQTAKNVSKKKTTGPLWTFFGAPASWSEKKESLLHYERSRGCRVGEPKDSVPTRAPSWLHDYSWLDKLPPPKNKKVSDLSEDKEPNWYRDEVSSVAHSITVENKRAVERADGPNIKKIMSHTGRAINRRQERVQRQHFRKKCKRCMIEVHRAEDWHKRLAGRIHNGLRNKIERYSLCKIKDLSQLSTSTTLI